MKKLLCLSLVLVLVLGTISCVSASTKTASNSQAYYSWVGIKIFSTGVRGDYDTNGKKVTSFGKTSSTPQCWFLWTSSNKQSWWCSTTNTTQAKCYGEAKFCLGVTTDDLTIGVQSLTVGIEAVGKP